MSPFVRGGWTFVHGETQAGTPACAAAILAVISELSAIDVERTTGVLGAELLRIANSLEEKDRIAAVTGRGCFLGLELRREDGAEYSGDEVLRAVSTIAEAGVVVHPGPSSIELIPAYGYTQAELHELESALESGLRQFRDEFA